MEERQYDLTQLRQLIAQGHRDGFVYRHHLQALMEQQLTAEEETVVYGVLAQENIRVLAIEEKLQLALEEIPGRLTELETQILRFRLGPEEGAAHGLTETAAHFGVSLANIRLREDMALRKLFRHRRERHGVWEQHQTLSQKPD